jgi:hypothetical protein
VCSDQGGNHGRGQQVAVTRVETMAEDRRWTVTRIEIIAEDNRCEVITVENMVEDSRWAVTRVETMAEDRRWTVTRIESTVEDNRCAVTRVETIAEDSRWAYTFSLNFPIAWHLLTATKVSVLLPLSTSTVAACVLVLAPVPNTFSMLQAVLCLCSVPSLLAALGSFYLLTDGPFCPCPVFLL